MARISYSDLVYDLPSLPEGIVSTYINSEWYGVKLENGKHVDLIDVSRIESKTNAFNTFNNHLAKRITIEKHMIRMHLYGTGIYCKNWGHKLQFNIVDNYGNLKRVSFFHEQKIGYVLHSLNFGGLGCTLNVMGSECIGPTLTRGV